MNMIVKQFCVKSRNEICDLLRGDYIWNVDFVKIEQNVNML